MNFQPPDLMKFTTFENLSGPFSRYHRLAQNESACTSGRSQNHICLIGVETLPELINHSHGRQMFANKFQWNFQPMAWDCLLAWNYHKVKTEKATAKLPMSHYSFLDNVKLQYSRKWGEEKL